MMEYERERWLRVIRMLTADEAPRIVVTGIHAQTGGEVPR
jgi:hypothetical protein